MKFLRKYRDEDLPLIKSYSSYIETLSYFYKPSFVHLWKDHNDIYIYEGTFGLYIYMKAFNAFLLPWSANMYEALDELRQIAKAEELDQLVIKSIPDKYLHFFHDDRYDLFRNRDLDEYIYLQEKLIGLSGRQLQSKRNHISQFMKSYPECKVVAMEKKDSEKILEMTKAWIDNMPDEFKKDLQDEYVTLERAFQFWDEFEFSGAILKDDEKIVAYSIGENQNNEVVVHYEKADTSYHGAYSMINKEYQQNFAPHKLFVNRMEDAGVEGLRKAKESYKPIRMVQKWEAKLK